MAVYRVIVSSGHAIMMTRSRSASFRHNTPDYSIVVTSYTFI